MEAIHSLLCGELSKKPQEVTVTDNGPGLLSHSAIVFASMGSRVIAKEPDDRCRKFYLGLISAQGRQSLESKITFRSRQSKIDEPTPVDIAYWTNPSYEVLSYRDIKSSLNYMGRDVVRGGFMVLQTDLVPPKYLKFDEERWQVIYGIELLRSEDFKGIIMATIFHDHINSFYILRRI